MCEDLEEVPPGLTRRRFVQSVGAIAAGGWLFGRAPVALASAIDGTPAVSMAMHIHSSFSEQYGSVQDHLFQAVKNNVNVLWLTDHDHRMKAWQYRSVVHFTSLTAENTDGPAWLWQRRVAGSLATSAGGIVTDPASPNDPIAGGSLAVSALSTSAALAKLGFYAESKPANWNYRGNLYGQTLTVDVLPTAISGTGYLELLVASSYHQASNGRPAGTYSLSYRIGGPGAPGDRVVNGNQGIVYLAAIPGQWNTVAMTPCDDIAALWPEMQSQDFACYGLTLSAVSTGGQASGNFDYLRFSRQYVSGDLPLATQRDIMSFYTPSYSAVAAYQGLELSLLTPHVNWFGPGVTLGDFTGVTAGNYASYLRGQVAAIHAAGGVASYNHPFGTSGGTVLPLSTQDSKVSTVAAQLLANNLLDCDLLEVGYTSRAGIDLAHHVALWDVLSRNGRLLTGNGVTDDHIGTNWYGLQSNWITSVWAPGSAQPDLITALRAGRAWTGSLSRFRGGLDLLADGVCPMGSASVSAVSQRTLTVLATQVPAGGAVEVVRGVCDYTGTTPNSTVVASLAASALIGGSASVPIDTTTSCFVRSQVRDSAGVLVALSNPLWLLHETPPTGIPPARAC